MTWPGTFLFLLLPGVVVGLLLGLAEHLRRTTGNPRGRLLVWSPFAFAAVLVVGIVRDGFHVEGGIGTGAIGLPAFSIIGAYALAGRRRWARVACGLLVLVPVPILLLLEVAGGTSVNFGDPRGVWMSVYLVTFIAVLMVATSIPLRIPPRRPAGPLATVSALPVDATTTAQHGAT
ncbi:MAG: hypothetical protein GC156_09970 [Actinomycetales bacterium]|nr:hypothetical protein [Actinomycetales bacterium]